ncbi:MAG: IS4 family transposase [Bacteroidia bacterium]|nr:IS4 family transposase [Bacteroidia bacterium]
MSKSTFFTGQPIFSQVLSLIPKPLVRRVCQEHQADHYCKKFFFHDHLVTMLFSSFHSCTGLREVITGMQAEGDRLMHFGLKNTPRKSTLADSNIKRPHTAFEDLFHQLVSHYFKGLPDSRSKNDIRRLFIIDSTTFTLFSTVMRGAGTYGLNGKKKGGAKAHVVLDSLHDTPAFIRITESRKSDKTFLNHVNIPSNTSVVLDKGYNQYNTFSGWSRKDIRWYTRLNKAAVYEVMEELPLTQDQIELGVLDDQMIKLGNPVTRKKTPLQDARLVQYYDAESKRKFYFLTNDFISCPYEVAQMYRRRWQIEMFFKRLKQNFPLKCFLGDSENAIRIQIWCSLIADLLIKVIMDKMHTTKKWSFANLCGLIRLHLGTYINLWAFLKNPEKSLLNYKPPDRSMQAKLF